LSGAGHVHRGRNGSGVMGRGGCECAVTGGRARRHAGDILTMLFAGNGSVSAAPALAEALSTVPDGVDDGIMTMTRKTSMS